MKTGRIIAVLAVSLLAVLVLVLLWIGRGGREPEGTVVSVTEKQAMTFAEGEIRRIAGEGGPDCTWDDTTAILQGRPLYGPDDRCNGYVCRLTTGGMETGYLQVDALGGELCTGAYSFDGIPAYEGLAEEGGGTASEERLYFSATISREVMDISWIYQRDPEEITVQATQENKPDILQYRLDVDSDAKVDAIAAIIKKQGLERVICFCNTKGSTERLTKFLQMRGLDAQCIHGDIPQKKREEVMAQFREGKLHVFVATDVASRGIDVDDVDAVFNFDVPEENEYYVHRIGRTGRAKRHGVAYTLLSDFPSRMRLDDIARNTRSQIVSAKLEGDGTVVPLEK